MTTAVHNAFISGDFPIAEQLLTQDIEADPKNYASYANRSFVMMRLLDWDRALHDATMVGYADSSHIYGLTGIVSDIVRQHSGLLHRLYLQGHCPLWQNGSLGCDESI
jgi:hypothetical protein